MEFAKDLLAGLRDRIDAGAEAMPTTRCDWHGISARLQAAHAARIELHRIAGAALAVPRGSFAEAAGSVWQHGEHGSRGVNPSALGDGKAAGGIAAEAPAEWQGDGRG